MMTIVHWIRTSGLRLLSAIVLSFALWIYVSYSENPDQSTSFEGMPVYVQNLPRNLVIVDQDGMPRTDQSLLSQISLFVKTDQETLRGLRQRQLRAFVDLSNFPPGENQVKVSVESTTSDVRLSSFSDIDPEPEYLSVRLDEWVQRTAPLSIEVQGNLPFSFERGQAEATVDGEPIQQVAVSGPQERVERVARVNAVANIEQLRASYASMLQLIALDSNGDVVRGIEISPTVVNVRIPIRSVVGLKRVPVLGMVTGTPADGYTVQQIACNPPLINITGSSGRLDHIDNIETFPIAIDGATSSLTRSVELDFPSGVLGGTNDDVQVEVIIEIVPLIRPFQVRLPFTVEVAGGGYLIDYHPKILFLTIQGTSTALAQIDPTTLVAMVDGEDLTPGRYERPPRFTLPEGVQMVGEIPIIEITVSPNYPTATPTTPIIPTPLGSGVMTPTIITTIPGPPTPTQPITITPDTDMPDTDMPDTDMPDTDMPDTDMPDTEITDTETPHTETPLPFTSSPDPFSLFPSPEELANPSPSPTSTVPTSDLSDEHDVPVLAPDGTGAEGDIPYQEAETQPEADHNSSLPIAPIETMIP